MSAVDDVDQVLEQYHLAAAEFIKENPEPYKMVCEQLNFGQHALHELLTLSPTPRAPLVHNCLAQRGNAAQDVL